MKKWIGISLGLIVIIAFVIIIAFRIKSTSDSTTTQSTTATTASSKTVDSNSKNNTANNGTNNATDNNATASSNVTGDYIDLTKLSSTMVYSEVFNMMVKPENYIGKTIKMKGNFSLYHDDAKNKDYYACIIQDATACCSQGIEFITTDEFKYPDNYPAVGDIICVEGVFDTYVEDGRSYVTLRNAKIL